MLVLMLWLINLLDSSSVLTARLVIHDFSMLFQLFSQETLLKFVPRYSLVVELQDGGTCVRSFHDPHGTVAGYISEAHEHNGHLYLGSFRSPYLCKLDLSKV